MSRLVAVAGIGALCLSACDAPTPESTGPAAPTPAEPITVTTTAGELTATVTVRPKEPRLGDALELSLVVEGAGPALTLEMPSFRPTLGRFTVTDFQDADPETSGHSTRYRQTYQLEAPGSGRYRIPPFRLELTRSSAQADGGTTETTELLTDEVPIQIASVLAEGDADQPLQPPLGALPPHLGPSPLRRHGPLAGAALAILLLVVGWIRVRSHRQKRIQITAYDKATRRLQSLAQRGLPEPELADGWYVELSNIVRTYLEDRFALRAPELTTEEFLREAKRSPDLTTEQRRQLSAFLDLCDRVKFAGHHPATSESESAMISARHFIDETRLVAEDSR